MLQGMAGCVPAAKRLGEELVIVPSEYNSNRSFWGQMESSVSTHSRTWTRSRVATVLSLVLEIATGAGKANQRAAVWCLSIHYEPPSLGGSPDSLSLPRLGLG